jgi:hypothetical protein
VSIKKVGRPTISESEVPAHILEGLLHKSRGESWCSAAKKVGVKYQTLKEWYNENPEANRYLRQLTQARNEKIQDSLDNAYELLIDEAPAISKEFIKLLKSDKIKPYTKSELFGNFFRIIERGWSDKKLNEALLETKERIDSLENGRPVQLIERSI